MQPLHLPAAAAAEDLHVHLSHPDELRLSRLLYLTCHKTAAILSQPHQSTRLFPSRFATSHAYHVVRRRYRWAGSNATRNADLEGISAGSSLFTMQNCEDQV